MRPFALALTLAALSLPAWAQDDTPIPYPDEEGEVLRRPKTSQPTLDAPGVDEPLVLTDYDDPSKGFAAELLSALVLLDASQGGGVAPRFGWGARLTWEAGRLFRNDLLHEGLFLDATWLYHGVKEGTQEVSVGTNYHAFTLAPAFGLPFGAGSPFAAYLQLGGGVTFQHAVLSASGRETTVSGIKPTFLYGIGIRARPLLHEPTGLRLVLRIEATRFRRAYMDDTYLGASLGAGF